MHRHCNDYSRSHAVAGAGLPVIEPGMPAPAGTGLTRRSMMLRSLGLGMAVYGAGAIQAPEHVEAAINDALGEHKVVISVFIDGGWDALSLLVPVGTDSRHEARVQALRPNLLRTVDRAQATPFSADPSLSWHPAAGGLRDLWQGTDVGMAVAPAVGYASPNYSHFTSRHFWEVGALDIGGTTGWMGRYLDRVGKANVPVQGITLGGALSPTLATSKVPVTAIQDIDAYKFSYTAGGWLPGEATAEMRGAGAAATGDAQRDQARLVGSAAFDVLGDLTAAAAMPLPTVAYPTESSAFVDSLKDTARVLGARVGGNALPVRCVALRGHGGYDTHGAQEPNFSSNLRITANAIKAFWADLKARGEDDRVVMLVWSEFGRRPQENGSSGCDHGAAGTAFVIGKSVKQGLIGEFPGLTAYGSTGAGLMVDGNLRATSDFRGIYSALLEQWLGTEADGIIPGAGAQPGAGAFARPALL